MAKVGRNEPCPCGSGKKYKRCCIDQAMGMASSVVAEADCGALEAAAKTPEGMEAEREQYAKTWSDIDAAAFDRDGHYAWMAEHVTEYRRVLEIGGGDGRGTLALLRAGHHVVSVDENPACLKRAKDRLDRAGFPVAIELRGAVVGEEGGYRVTYDPVVSTSIGPRCLLIEGDTLNDQHLLCWLKTKARPFDAVVCWLIGSHRARPFNVELHEDDAPDYRLRVQNGLYVLADEVLRSGGVLNVIDRGTIGLTEEIIEQLRVDKAQSHWEQASATSLRVDYRVNVRAYDPPDGVPMQLTLGTSGCVLRDVTTGLVSVLARKP